MRSSLGFSHSSVSADIPDKHSGERTEYVKDNLISLPVKVLGSGDSNVLFIMHTADKQTNTIVALRSWRLFGLASVRMSCANKNDLFLIRMREKNGSQMTFTPCLDKKKL